MGIDERIAKLQGYKGVMYQYTGKYFEMSQEEMAEHNKHMEEFRREFNRKMAQSREDARHIYITE